MTMQVGIARQLLNWLLRAGKRETTKPSAEGISLLGCKLFLVLNTLLWGVIGGVVCLVVWAGGPPPTPPQEGEGVGGPA